MFAAFRSVLHNTYISGVDSPSDLTKLYDVQKGMCTLSATGQYMGLLRRVGGSLSELGPWPVDGAAGSPSLLTLNKVA